MAIPILVKHCTLNSLRPRRNRRYFADDIFKSIFFNENVWILLQISQKIVPKVRINNIPALVQIMAWRQPGDKPLSEPMMFSLLTHICVTQPQWVNPDVFSYGHWGELNAAFSSVIFTVYWKAYSIEKPTSCAGLQGFLFASAIGHSPTKYLFVRTQWCKQDKMSWIKTWYFPIVSKLIQKLLYNTIVLTLL